MLRLFRQPDCPLSHIRMSRKCRLVKSIQKLESHRTGFESWFWPLPVWSKSFQFAESQFPHPQNGSATPVSPVGNVYGDRCDHKCEHNAWFLNRAGGCHYWRHLADKSQRGRHSFRRVPDFFLTLVPGFLLCIYSFPGSLLSPLSHRSDMGCG